MQNRQLVGICCMRGRFEREGTYVCLWLIHADVNM